MLCVTFTSPTDTHAGDTVYHARSVTIAAFGVVIDAGHGRLTVADVTHDGGTVLFSVASSRGNVTTWIVYQDIRIEHID
jgi:hypothetical protein